MTRSVVLVGGPDTGKTNFVGRLWLALQSGRSTVVSSGLPQRIDYVQQVVAHLHQGCFAPRTEKNTERTPEEVILPVTTRAQADRDSLELVIPDVSGELWEKAVTSNQLAPRWMDTLEKADGAILFVRVLSDLNVDPIDWVTAGKLMLRQGDAAQPHRIPTQVILCELLRFLEESLHRDKNAHGPRVAVVVTAWDLLDHERRGAGPVAYLEREYPLFAGRLADLHSLDVMIFGMSVLGGDLKHDPTFRKEFLAADVNSAGYTVYTDQGSVRSVDDLTLPVSWAMGEQFTTT